LYFIFQIKDKENENDNEKVQSKNNVQSNHITVTNNKDFMLRMIQQQTLIKKNLSTDEIASNVNSNKIKIIIKNQSTVKFDYMRAALEKYTAKRK
jgi:hypothetical protein